MADMEDGCEIQVGGLAVELGFFQRPSRLRLDTSIALLGRKNHGGYPGVVRIRRGRDGCYHNWFDSEECSKCGEWRYGAGRFSESNSPQCKTPGSPK